MRDGDDDGVVMVEKEEDDDNDDEESNVGRLVRMEESVEVLRVEDERWRQLTWLYARSEVYNRGGCIFGIDLLLSGWRGGGRMILFRKN